MSYSDGFYLALRCTKKDVKPPPPPPSPNLHPFGIFEPLIYTFKQVSSYSAAKKRLEKLEPKYILRAIKNPSPWPFKQPPGSYHYCISRGGGPADVTQVTNASQMCVKLAM